MNEDLSNTWAGLARKGILGRGNSTDKGTEACNRMPSAEERREINPGTSDCRGTWGPYREGQLYPRGPGKRLGEGLKQETWGDESSRRRTWEAGWRRGRSRSWVRDRMSSVWDLLSLRS